MVHYSVSLCMNVSGSLGLYPSGGKISTYQYNKTFQQTICLCILPVGRNSALPPPLLPPKFGHGPHPLTAQQRQDSWGKARCRHCHGERRQCEHSKATLVLKWEHLCTSVYWHMYSISLRGDISQIYSYPLTHSRPYCVWTYSRRSK